MFHVEQKRSIESILISGAEEFGLTLSDETIKKFLVYFEELTRWNEKINLTGLSSTSDIVVNLFVDSLAFSLAQNHRMGQSFIDIGSGGGFPGLPLKIVFPHISLTLVEPKLKKVAFLHHIIGALSLDDVCVKPQTIQDYVRMPSRPTSYDVVTFKAVKPENLFPTVLSLLHPESRVCIYRSRSIGTGISHFHMLLDREIVYQLPKGYGERVLSVLRPLATDVNCKPCP